MNPRTVVSYQSHVAFGHVGNSVAVFAMQRMGVEVWPVHTLQLSNHPGYGDTGGGRFAGGHLLDVMTGLARRGVLCNCDALLTGYLGGLEAGEILADVVARLPADNPDVIVCCDPVIGDHDTGVFVPDEVAALLRDRIVPCATLLTPNHFELGWLLGERGDALPEPVAAARELAAATGAAVLVTGIEPADDPRRIHSLLIAAGATARVACPKVDLGRRPDGAGDLFAAVFLARYLIDRDGPRALAHAAAAVHGVIASTARAGARELAIIAAQGELVEPSLSLEVTRVL